MLVLYDRISELLDHTVELVSVGTGCVELLPQSLRFILELHHVDLQLILVGLLECFLDVLGLFKEFDLVRLSHYLYLVL